MQGGGQKFGIAFKTQGNQTFGRDALGFLPGYPAVGEPEKFQRIAKGAGGKGPRQKTSKIVKKCQKVFRHFSTIFARHLFSGPFCNPLKSLRTKKVCVQFPFLIF